MNIEQQVINIQQQIFNQQGLRTDVHIKEGVGILITPENAALIPQNVVLMVPWHILIFGSININFETSFEEDYSTD